MYIIVRNVLAITVLLALAAISWIFSRPTANSEPQQSGSTGANSGYYLKNATMLGTNTDGRIYYRLMAEQIEQSSGGDELIFQVVQIQYDANTDTNWQVSAGEARASRELSVLNLSNGVVLTGTTTSEHATVLEMNTLTLDTNKSLASTVDSVSLVHGQTRLRATGLRADLSRDYLELISDVSANLVR